MVIEMRIVNGELDKNFTGINLMDDNITYREKIKKELGIDIKENPNINHILMQLN